MIVSLVFMASDVIETAGEARRQKPLIEPLRTSFNPLDHNRVSQGP
jgi:hypothetical protein